MTAVLVGPGGTITVEEPVTVDGTVEIGNVPANFPDTYSGGEVLADQAGTGSVLTFTFASPVELLWVRCDGGDARADPFGGTPDVDSGIFCEDGVPNPITVTTDEVAVFAAAGTVRVWGYRYS